MPTPKNCLECKYQFRCNTAMYTKGCGFYPPSARKEEKINPIMKFFGKFFIETLDILKII